MKNQNQQKRLSFDQLIKKFEAEASKMVGKPVTLKPFITEIDTTQVIDHDTLVFIIKQIVAGVTSSSIDWLESKSREREKCDGRYICFRLIQWSTEKFSTKISLKKIGSYFSDRDHSTIIKGLEKYDDLYETDRAFRKQADDAISLLIDQLVISKPQPQLIEEFA